ncbi:MAG: hypothetical protein LBF27_14230 [Sphingobacterium sp.]|jgi:Leucine-rich repeat (LRR) protein|nr:hypothetical protein [Sphingobacterium sp.]
MVVKAEKYSAEEISKFDPASIAVISIETTIDKVKVGAIKELLQKNNDIRIVLVVDPAETGNDEKYSNLAIVETLGDLKHLAVLAFGSEQLQDIRLLSGLKSLVSFRLDGNYKKDMDLAPLANATGIEELELEFGPAGAKQISFVSGLAHLRHLKASVLDLKKAVLNDGLESLIITNTIKNPELLATICPQLSKLAINKVVGVEAFDFITPLHNLRNLQIGHTNKLISMPKMERPMELRSLHLVNTRQFEDMESLMQFNNLEELKITEPTKMTITEFSRLKELKSLKKVYAVFQTESEDNAFQQMAEQTGWEF